MEMLLMALCMSMFTLAVAASHLERRRVQDRHLHLLNLSFGLSKRWLQAGSLLDQVLPSLLRDPMCP